MGRLDNFIEQEEMSESRLESLAEFQITALLHAFRFPNVKKVVYSTCSKHQQENEGVVQKALLDGRFKLTTGVFPEWTRRGLPLFDGGFVFLTL